jgi:hypothetical protein
MTNRPLNLSVLQEAFALCRLKNDAQIPDWALFGSFSSITRTAGELSIVCRQSNVPEGIRCEKGWRCLQVEGPLGFPLTGILTSLLTPLAQARIPVFVISTYDTDYVMIQERNLEGAVLLLSQAGHRVQ